MAGADRLRGGIFPFLVSTSQDPSEEILLECRLSHQMSELRLIYGKRNSLVDLQRRISIRPSIWISPAWKTPQIGRISMSQTHVVEQRLPADTYSMWMLRWLFSLVRVYWRASTVDIKRDSDRSFSRGSIMEKTIPSTELKWGHWRHKYWKFKLSLESWQNHIESLFRGHTLCCHNT